MGTPLHPIPSDGYHAEAWNDWLTRHGFPSLWQIAPKNPSGEFGVPFRIPPYNDDPTIENRIARNWVRVFSRKAKKQVLNLTSEQARLAREQADAQALKNAFLRGEYVPASEVERAWSDTLRALRSRLLAVPSRLRQSMQHLTTSDVTMIDRELRDALQELGHADA